MVKRPIINTRDEPHADREKYRRLHVIVGDANLSEYTIYLRNGVTEDRALDDRGRGDPTRNLVAAGSGARRFKQVSHDPELQEASCRLDNGKKMSAVQIQNGVSGHGRFAYVDCA